MQLRTRSKSWLVLLLLSACAPARDTVVIFHAGSLSALVQEVSDRFESNHPNVLVQPEASGSLDAIRKVTELGKSCDLLAVADHRLIERFLIPQWVKSYYIFLGNEMVLATNRKGLLGRNRTHWQENWYQELSSRGYSYGISDPDRDPAGYYAHLCWKLAEIHYNHPALYRSLLGGLDSRWIRPKSSELVALLQGGALDFAFLYKSTALQNELEFLVLPPQVSLGEETYQELYSRVFVYITGESPGSTLEISGTAIRYGIALVNPNKAQAREILEFFLSPEVQEFYRELGYVVVPITEVRRQK